MATRLILVDDHPLIRIGVRAMLMSQGDKFEIIAEAGCAQELYNHISNGLVPDVILLDLVMPEITGVEAAKVIKKNHPEIAILIMSSEITPDKIKELASSQIEGYISKNYSQDELIDAIDSVSNGLTYYGKDVSKIIRDIRLSKTSVSDAVFSERETEIIKLCREGYSAKAIADKLCLSSRTVSNYKQNIFSKMGINTTLEMVDYALKHGIISSI